MQLSIWPDLASLGGGVRAAPILQEMKQIERALNLGEQLIDLPTRFAGMEVLKFQQLVRPGDQIELHLRFDRERSKLYFAYRNGVAACSSGRIVLEAAHA